MGNDATKKIIRYTLTPEIIPRFSSLFFSGFSFIAFFMAQLYAGARLLPPDHPYVNPDNMGRFGIKHVVAEASSKLKFNLSNIDQVIIFGLTLIGIAILFGQLAILALSMGMQASYAGLGPVPDTFASYFLLPAGNATHDIAYVLLDRVFGIPDMFVDVGNVKTCVAQGVPCFDLGQSTRTFTPDNQIYTQINVKGGIITPASPVTIAFPFPFHLALHQMLEVYSIGILYVAVLIFAYFVAAVVAETAQSGTPFGRRFNHVWAPLRIIAAVGMLVPLTNGLNSGQYILLWAAKWGSAFASNGWVLFHNTATGGGDTLLGPSAELVAEPNGPPVNTLIEFGSILATCKNAYETMYHARPGRTAVVIDAYLVNPQDLALAPQLLSGTAYDAALAYFGYSDFIIRFGHLETSGNYQTSDLEVAPLCGEIKLEIYTPELAGSGIEPGPAFVQQEYYELIRRLWADASSACGGGYTAGAGVAGAFDQQGCIGENIANRYLPINNDPNAQLPPSATLEAIRSAYQTIVDTIIVTGVNNQRGSTEWAETLEVLGWGGAAIWYNKVAQLNGSMISAAFALPVIKKYPEIMEINRRERAASDTDTPGQSRHQCYQGTDRTAYTRDEEHGPICRAMYAAQDLWADHNSEQTRGGDIWVDVVNAILGTQGLFDIHQNANNRIHPLAQLSAIGRGIVDTALRNLGFSVAAGLGGGIINMFGDHLVGKVGMIASNFLSQLAVIGLSIGFVLYYVIPFLPFIYFFFAVGGWIKGIFEAMVGVPLWALAHIRIDGNGLPGDAGIGGYYLILEVFLRPILIVFGFLASITIFGAQVQVLHEIWAVVTSNVSGFDEKASTKIANPDEMGALRYLRSAVDKFFFTVIYAIIVYMLGMSAFKMIDLVPNHILRWMGASVSTFGDQAGDPAENLVRNAFIGGNMVSSPLGQAGKQLKDAGGHLGQAAQDLTQRQQG